MERRRWLPVLCLLVVALPAIGADPPAVEAGRPIARLGIPRLQIGYPLAFAADGKTFVGVSPDGELVRHDAATGAEIERIKIPDERYRHSLSADGTRCLLTTRRDFMVWDLRNGRRLLDVAPRGFEVRCELSPDGRLVASHGGAEEGRGDSRDADRRGRAAAEVTPLDPGGIRPGTGWHAGGAAAR